jgi:A/G-specific adenine glycosylase
MLGSDIMTNKEEANSHNLLEIISPIGLTYRAALLKAAAAIIITDYGGHIPDHLNELLGLPSVGDYIAKAILCYGYHQAIVPIDTNVIRLFSRYFGLSSKSTRPRTDKLLASILEIVSAGFKLQRG